MRIFLVGFMGAGKSHLGRALAQRLGFAFVDLDEVVEERAGTSVSSIFQGQGESAFRQMEANALRSLVASDNLVVATGGGAPCFHGNMDWMNEHGTTIYLSATAKLLTERLLPEKAHRPLLAVVADADLEDFIGEKIAERTFFYGECQLEFKVPDVGLEGLEGLADYLRRFFYKKN